MTTVKKFMKLMKKQYISLIYHIGNEEIRNPATVPPKTTHLMKKRLRWYGHVKVQMIDILH